MDKTFYKEYYTLERKHWWFRVRSEIIEDYIRRVIYKGEPLKILNIGVATGATSDLLSKFGDVTSLEYDEECCDFLRDELKMEVINGSILELPFKENEFDLVCAFDVIEHVEDDALGIVEMKRVSKTNGSIFVSVPALNVLWSQHDEVNHHHRRYTLKGLRNVFTESKGGKEEFSSYFNSLLFLPIFAVRMVSKLLPKRKNESNSGSDFSIVGNKTLSSILYKLFKLEYYWLKKRTFPIGVSILYHWRKEN